MVLVSIAWFRFVDSVNMLVLWSVSLFGVGSSVEATLTELSISILVASVSYCVGSGIGMIVVSLSGVDGGIGVLRA